MDKNFMQKSVEKCMLYIRILKSVVLNFLKTWIAIRGI